MGSRERFLDKSIRDRPLTTGPHGLPMCRWCQGPVFPPKETFCSPSCTHEWKLRTGTRYAKAVVEARDNGVCAYCSIDCKKQKKQLLELRDEDRLMFLRSLHKIKLTESDFNKRKYLWDLDHIVRVTDGGGSAGLDNLQTLCASCHRIKTAYENSVTTRKPIKAKKQRRKTRR